MSTPAWPGAELRERLATPRQTLTELMQVLGEVEAVVPQAPTWSVGISANLTTALAESYFKKHAYLHGLGCRFVAGGYDVHLDNVRAFLAQGLETMVLIDFFDNLAPSFEAQLAHLEDAAVEAHLARVQTQLHLVLTAARPLKRVFLLRYHRFTPPPPGGGVDAVATALAAFAARLEDTAAAFPNVRLLSPGDVVAALGRPQALDARFYYSFKAPYTAAFWDELARRVLVATRGGGTQFYKALVLDADNTLWGGVVGEEGSAGLQLGPHDYPGNVYWTVQQGLLRLQRAGALLCLCSKNDPAEVAEVLARHPHQVLRDAHFVLQKLGWRDKVTGLREIAAELGIGLDSLVFLDDSAFECEAVRAQLPEVKVLQVPRHVFEYPALLQTLEELFTPGDGGAVGGGAIGGDAADKTAQYRQRAQTLAARASFDSHEAYLASLGIRVTLWRDNPAQVVRLAALAQKTNQFNLTTRRYGEGELQAAMAEAERAVYALGVRDKFGDAGLTGLIVVRFAGATAHVECCLLSCRVLGRGIELAPWERVFADARARGCERVEAAFVATAKNDQVADFYARLGLAEAGRDAAGTRYAARLADLAGSCPPHIEVDDGH